MISLKSNPWQVHTAHLQFHWKCINKKTHMRVKVDGESTYQQALSILLPCPTTYIQVTKSWHKVVLRFTQRDCFHEDVKIIIYVLEWWSSPEGPSRDLECLGDSGGLGGTGGLHTLEAPRDSLFTWMISTRNYIFSLSLSYALVCPFLASYIYPPVT